MASVAAMRVQKHSEDDRPCEGSRPVDLVHLSRFTLGDATLEHEVLELFRVQAGIYLERLKMAADPTGWREAAHTIKGSARGIGAWSVAEAAAAAEALDDPKSKNAAQALAALDCAVGEAIAFIDPLLADH
jgi:HPt (histidine-containing phosphotransfer) domain-containing protein